MDNNDMTHVNMLKMSINILYGQTYYFIYCQLCFTSHHHPAWKRRRPILRGKDNAEVNKKKIYKQDKRKQVTRSINKQVIGKQIHKQSI